MSDLEDKWRVNERSIDYRNGRWSDGAGSGASFEAGRRERQAELEQRFAPSIARAPDNGNALIGLLMLPVFVAVLTFAISGVFGGLGLWLVLRKVFRVKLPDRPMHVTWTASGAFLAYCFVQVWALNLKADTIERALAMRSFSEMTKLSEVKGILDAWGMTTVYQMIPVPNPLSPSFWSTATVSTFLYQFAAVAVSAGVVKWSHRDILPGVQGYAQAAVGALALIATSIFFLSRDFAPNPVFACALFFFSAIISPFAGHIAKRLGGASYASNPFDAAYGVAFAGLTVSFFGGLALGYDPMVLIDPIAQKGVLEYAMLLIFTAYLVVMLPTKLPNRLLNSVLIAAVCALGWVIMRGIVVWVVVKFGPS